ncbi:MAG: DEAD/DEAH box helicase [Deltaproteobacteria bacterium]|nr:DEAD/DEAH box helicase [Deltaproteobacteria bacterium]
MSNPTLSPLHPAIAAWFAERHGAPTAVQTETWPAIARGDHVLATAPTGSGKTLAATLMALQSLLTGRWPAGELSVLYVSPLKALSADVHRNLLAPLAELGPWLRDRGVRAPAVRVALRTGDTAQRDRAATLRTPPEVLVTTPESLHILLVSASGRRLLAQVRLCILDEIHAVAGNHRGTLLLSAVEELTRIAGPVQRVALSATVRPLDQVARLVGGWEGQGAQRQPRPVTTIAPMTPKSFDLQVIDAEMDALEPNAPRPDGDDGGFWPAAARVLRRGLWARRSTLLFTQSRRTAERLARELNEAQPMPIAWAHHGSLAQELRRTVEARLKAGELRAVCATSSLELGIDVGAVDEVVLVGAPRSVASALQRVGRAGHQVGATSRGRLLPFFGRDVLRCAVLVDLMHAGVLEPIAIPRHPADVLAQLILARVAAVSWTADALFDHLRQADPFAELLRSTFDAVVQMLAGRWAGLRVRELQPRIDVHPDGRLVARKGMATLVIRSGGVIADRGYYKLVVHGSGTPIGELDEEFVWERRTGDVFAIGAQAWQVVEKTRDTVSVAPARRGAAMAPFWRADPDDRGPLLSEATLDWLARIEPWIDKPELPQRLAERGTHDPAAVQTLATLLRDVHRALGALPTRGRVVVELCKAPETSATQALLHLGWGGVVLRPLGLALRAWLQHSTGEPWQMQSGDDCILLRVPDGHDILGLLGPFLDEPLDPWLRAGLRDSAALGLRFRFAVGTALVLPRSIAGRRTPLFQTRERSKQLLAAVAHDAGFPLLADAMRACLDEQFDVPRLQAWLDRWRSGQLEVRVVHTSRPSPLADGVVFLSEGELIYETDRPGAAQPAADGAHGASGPLVLPAAVVADLRARRMRTDPAWAAETMEELRDLVAELSPVDRDEWQAVVAAAAEAQGRPLPDVAADLAPAVVELPWGARAAASEAPTVAAVATHQAAAVTVRACLARWFAARGPVTMDRAALVLGVPGPDLQAAVAPMLADGTLLADVRVSGSDAPCWCDRGFADACLRRRRSLDRGRVQSVAADDLVLLRAHRHGLVGRGRGPVAVARALDLAQGQALDLGLVESAFLPARVVDYRPGDLDAALADHGLVWCGAGDVDAPQVWFAPAEAAADWRDTAPGDAPPALAWLTDPDAAYPADVLLRKAGFDRALLSRQLFEAVWAGQLVCAGFASLRKGLQHRFAPPPGSGRPLGAGRGQSGPSLVPWNGPWQRVPVAAPADPVASAEVAARRALAIARRLGVVHRTQWSEGRAGCSWRELWPALRRLDWSGKLVAGPWVAGWTGLQLAESDTERALHAARAFASQLWWVHSCDPAAPHPALLGWSDLAQLPVRAAGTWLVLRGSRLVAAVRRDGPDLTFLVAADDPELPAIAAVALERARRPGQPPLHIDLVNGQPAARSAYRAGLLSLGLHADHKGLMAG